MKKFFSLLLVFGVAVMLCTGCDPDPVRPTIEESSISHTDPTPQGVTVTFKAECPESTKVAVRFHQRSNGNQEITINAQYRPYAEKYFAPSGALVGGSTYAYYVVGYDNEGKECCLSQEHTFNVPKNGAPQAPQVSSVKVYAPTSLVASDGYIEGDILTKELEYSLDEGETWTAISEEGFIRGLRPGKVQLRVAETPTTEAGKVSTIDVPPYKSNTDLDGDGGKSEGVTSTGPK